MDEGADSETVVTILERLRKIAELLPAGASVTFTRETLLEALSAVEELRTAPADMTVAQLAERFLRSTSTVRSWLEEGRFPGAYKLRGRDWRIPTSAVDAFRDQERGLRKEPDVDLSGWRKHMRPG